MKKPFLLLLLLSTPWAIAQPSAGRQRVARIVRAPEHGQTFVSLDARTAQAIKALAESECGQELACQESLAYLYDVSCQSDAIMPALDVCKAIENVLCCLEQKSMDDITGDLRDYKESLDALDTHSSQATRRPFERIRFLEVDELRVYENAVINGNTTLVTLDPAVDALDVNGNSTFNGNVIVDGNLTVSGAFIAETTIGAQTVDNLTVNGNIFLADTNTSGSVGVLEISGVPYLHEGNTVVGSCTTFLGANAGNFSLTGTGNTGIGGSALNAVTTGSYNTAVGCGALNVNTTGAANTAVGFESLLSNTGGVGNTAIGEESLNKNTTGNSNTAVGYQALFTNTVGIDNTAVGYYALLNSTGSTNTAIGQSALTMVTTGGGNTALGNSAGSSYTTESNNLVLHNNGFAGDSAVIRIGNNVATNGIAMGYQALNAGIPNPLYNIAIGDEALSTNSAGANNVAVGYNALKLNITSNNTAIGYQALQNATVANLTAVGFNALTSNTTGTNNTAVGYIALSSNTTGAGNTAVGVAALSTNTTGTSNSAFGSNALALSTNVHNTAVGTQALQYITTGSNNIAVGFNAGSNGVAGPPTYTSNESNNIVIGNIGVTGDQGVIRIGTENLQTSCYIAGIFGESASTSNQPVLINSNGQLGTTTSSRRFKENIAPMSEESVNALCALEPVEFCYKSDKEHKKQFGLIAEQVHEVLPELVVYDTDGKPYSVAYHVLPAMLLAMVQNQQHTLEAQESALREHKRAIADLKQEVASLKRRK